MPELLRVGDFILVRGIDKGYIECLNGDNFAAVLFIVEKNTEIVPQNQFYQVPIVEGTELLSGHLRNIYSSPNQHTLLIISSQSNKVEEEDSGRG